MSCVSDIGLWHAWAAFYTKGLAGPTMTRHCIALLHAFSTEHPAAANVGKAHIPEGRTPGTSQTAPTRSDGGRLQTTLDPALSITRISFESSLEARAGQWWTEWDRSNLRSARQPAA